MHAINIQNDVIGLVLREICKSKQMIDFIAWPSRCQDTLPEILISSYKLHVLRSQRGIY